MHTEGSNIIRNYSSLTISFSFIRAYSQTIRVYSRPKKNPGRNWKLRRGEDSKSRNNLKPKQNYAENN
jgi:hypothetical protein